MVRRILVGHMSVEHTSGFHAILRIDVTGALHPARCLEALAIRRGGGTLAPVRSKGLAELRVDQLCQRGRARLVTDVPCLQPRELGVRRAGARRSPSCSSRS